MQIHTNNGLVSLDTEAFHASVKRFSESVKELFDDCKLQLSLHNLVVVRQHRDPVSGISGYIIGDLTESGGRVSSEMKILKKRAEKECRYLLMYGTRKLTLEDFNLQDIPVTLTAAPDNREGRRHPRKHLKKGSFWADKQQKATFKRK